MRFEVVLVVRELMDRSVVIDSQDLVQRYKACFDDDGDIVEEFIKTDENVIRVRSVYRLSKIEEDNYGISQE